MAEASKREGARAMLKQATYYLLDAYRDEGLDKDQASKKVLEDIEQLQQTLAEQNIVPERRNLALVNPNKAIDEVIKILNKEARFENPMSLRMILQRLSHLKSIFK